MAGYVMISYLSFFVFRFIVYVLAAQFATTVPVGDAAENLNGGMALLAQYAAGRYILLMFYATRISGFCPGLIAGAMGSESAY